MEKLILSQQEIEAIAARLGAQISADFSQQEQAPILICVMNGALNFTADLMKHISIDAQFDYVQVKSYEGVKSTGQVNMIKDVSLPLKGKDVIIVEDIVDSGLSMAFLTKYLKETYQPKSVSVCALFDKPQGRVNDVEVRYVGHVLEGNEFLVGYGLDYKNFVRNVPYVYVPSKDEIERWDRKAD